MSQDVDAYDEEQYLNLKERLTKHQEALDKADAEADSIFSAYKKLKYRNPSMLKNKASLGIDSLSSMHSRLLNLFLGDIVLSLPPRRRVKYKQAYEEFKLRFTFIFIAMGCLQLVLQSLWLDVLSFFLCLYYYSTVVLREHILVVNGSDIRAWWIAHHYVCVGVAGIMLIWPSGPSYYLMRPLLIKLFIFIGIFVLTGCSCFANASISIPNAPTICLACNVSCCSHADNN